MRSETFPRLHERSLARTVQEVVFRALNISFAVNEMIQLVFVDKIHVSLRQYLRLYEPASPSISHSEPSRRSRR